MAPLHALNPAFLWPGELDLGRPRPDRAATGDLRRLDRWRTGPLPP